VLYENNQGKMSDRASVMEAVYGNVDDAITAAYVEAMAGGRALNVSNTAFLDADKALQMRLRRSRRRGRFGNPDDRAGYDPRALRPGLICSRSAK
jgi:hypothetical protein